jgi:hypothetical protein
MTHRKPPPDPILTVGIIAEAKAGSIDRAREVLTNFAEMEGWYAAGMLLARHAASASGEMPPTHFYCVIPLARSVFQRLLAFISQQRGPLQAAATSGEDAEQSFLSAFGLRSLGQRWESLKPI